MSQLPTLPLRVADLTKNRAKPISVEPSDADLALIAAELDLVSLKKVRLEGKLAPVGKTDWRLTAMVGATAVQSCVVTLAPVTTRIDDDFSWTYVKDMDVVDVSEVEMTEDENTELLGPEIDLMAVLIEALALALPAYPRVDGAEIETTVFTEPGKAPMTDEDARPFAGLENLRDALENKGD